MSNKFFVYGTLKVGGYFGNLCDKFRTSCIKAKLFNHDLYAIGGKKEALYPGAIPGEGTVAGELHEYGNESQKRVIALLDSIEGYNKHDEKSSLYLRRVKKVRTENGEDVDAVVYIYNKSILPGFDKIENGVWEI